MSRKKFNPKEIAAKVRLIVEKLAKSYTSPKNVTIRAQAIVELWSGKSIKEVAKSLNYTRQSISKFRDRFQEGLDILNDLARDEAITEAELEREVTALLSDLHRSGRPLDYSLDQRVRIIGIACSDPEKLGYPLSYMTLPAIREEAIKTGVVEDISLSTVWRILNQAELKPHKTRPWLFADSRNKNPVEYDRRVRAICSLYLEVANSEVEEHTYFYSLDEKTGVSAKERNAPDWFSKPKKIAKLEHGYTRHGTSVLFGCLNIQTGKVLEEPFFRKKHRTVDWLEFIKFIISTDPSGSFTFVCDNFSTHVSEELVHFVARECGIKKDLGAKRKSGILFDMNSRREFLEDPTHRIRFLFIPAHSSWLNQIEIWFSIISRQLYNRKSFSSYSQLIQDTQDFIKRYNSTAQPFKWTYRGKEEPSD